ncbi:MAG: class I SAM-dependent methyltransferase [Nibricoccus sp.]
MEYTMNFDRLAPHYDWLEAVTAGARLQRARTQWLEALAGCRNILSVGEGHGRFAAACTRRFPGAQLTCVERSRGMLTQAQIKIDSGSFKIDWVLADVLSWQALRKYDAVVTCFFLDCFPADVLPRVIAKLANCATDDAIWLVTDFAIPSQGLARQRAHFVHWLMYRFFRVAVGLPANRLVVPDELLAAEGFHVEARHDAEWGLLRSDLWRRNPAKTAR